MTRCTRVFASFSTTCSSGCSGRTVTVEARALWSSCRLPWITSTMDTSDSFFNAADLSGVCAKPTTKSVAEATETMQPSSSTMATLETPWSLIAWKALSADCESCTLTGLVLQRSPAVHCFFAAASSSSNLPWRNCSSADWVMMLCAVPSAAMTTARRAGPEMTLATSSRAVSSPTSACFAPPRARPMTSSMGTSRSSCWPSAADLMV
mmetsp:Transcript_52860/g.169299  ORF Transcript_52860/g.169299 Transcript_52860/m.169299 type:complete len:208 (+) Transcript_52860:229-852(+)